MKSQPVLKTLAAKRARSNVPDVAPAFGAIACTVTPDAEVSGSEAPTKPG